MATYDFWVSMDTKKSTIKQSGKIKKHKTL